MKMPIFVRFSFVFSLLISLTALTVSADAQSEDSGTADIKLPQTGVLSDSGGANVNIGSLWGDVNKIALGEGAPLQSSVYKIRDNEWEMSLTNPSDDKLKVTINFVQYDSRNRQVKSTSYAYTLAPKQNVTRSVRTSATTVRCALIMKKWDKIEPKKEVVDEQPTEQPTTEEILEDLTDNIASID